MLPPRLFKYLPKQYAPAFAGRGAMLFRNLTYFRQAETKGRRDLLESLHMDFPDTPVTLENVTSGFKWEGRAAFLNSINADRVVVFCCSTILSDSLFTEFEADTCVEILDPEQFLLRVARTVGRQARFAASGLLHDAVEYYSPNAAVQGNVKDPKRIPFFKHAAYSHQQEYRLAASLKGGLRLTERIALPAHDLEQEITAGRIDHRIVYVGSLEDIICVHHRRDWQEAV